MKTIYFVKHPDSEQSGAKLNDMRRPLSPHGHKVALIMGKRLRVREIKPDHIYTSPSQRSIEAASIVAEELDFPRASIDVIEEVIDKDMDEIIDIIQNLDDQDESIMIFGNKPSFTDVIGFIAGDEMGELEDGCIACMSVDIDSWSELHEGSGEVKFILDPDDDPPETSSQDLLSPDF